MVLTDKALYNISKKKVKKRIPYENIIAISMSTMSPEFVVHVKNSNDYRYQSFNRKIEIVKEIIGIVCDELGMKKKFALYYVPMINLTKVMTNTKAFKKGKRILPDSDLLTEVSSEEF